MRLCKNCQKNIDDYRRDAIYCSKNCGVIYRKKIYTRTNKKYRDKRSEYFKKWYKKNKERQKKNCLDYYKKHKEKHVERGYVNRVLKIEFLKKNNKCSRCKSKENLEIHHIDYNKENRGNNILVLCRDCHRKEHRLKIDIE